VRCTEDNGSAAAAFAYASAARSPRAGRQGGRPARPDRSTVREQVVPRALRATGLLLATGVQMSGIDIWLRTLADRTWSCRRVLRMRLLSCRRPS